MLLEVLRHIRFQQSETMHEVALLWSNIRHLAIGRELHPPQILPSKKELGIVQIIADDILCHVPFAFVEEEFQTIKSTKEMDSFAMARPVDFC